MKKTEPKELFTLNLEAIGGVEDDGLYVKVSINIKGFHIKKDLTLGYTQFQDYQVQIS